MINKVESNINFLDMKPNKYNCGYETIYKILNVLYDNQLSLAEFFFLAAPFSFKIFDKKLILSYDTLEKISIDIQNNISKHVTWKRYFSDSISEIIQNIKKGNVCILFVNSDILFYHKMREMRCPYHMFIAHGYNCEKKSIIITDLYVQNDFETKKEIISISIEMLENNTLEYLVIEDDNQEVIKMNREKQIIIKQNIENAFLNQGIFEKNIILFFDNFNKENDASQRINALAVLKWMVIMPIFSMLLEYIELKVNINLFKDVDEIFEKWKIVDRRINTLCLEERVDGAMKFGREWAITKNVTKPNDARIKSGKYVKRKAGAIL